MSSDLSSSGGGITRKRVSTQFDKVNATLATITGMTSPLAAGVTYGLEVALHCNADATGGIKLAASSGDTLTASSIVIQATAYDDLSVVISGARLTALASTLTASGSAAIYAYMTGVITVGVSGTLAIQFAQSTANGTSSVLVGSTFNIWIIN